MNGQEGPRRRAAGPSLSLHIYPSPLVKDSRLERVSASLAGSVVDEVHLVGLAMPGLPAWQQLDERRAIWRVERNWNERFGIPRLRSAVAEIEWSLRIWARYRHRNVVYVHSESIDALLAGVMLKATSRGVKLIYAAQELETETHWLQGLRKRWLKAWERLLLRYVDSVTVVSPSIARWYKDEYPFLPPVHVIRNIPARPASPPRKHGQLRGKLGIPIDAMLFIYQGHLAPERGINVLLEVFRSVDPSKHIVFMGEGPSEPDVREHASRYPNIHYHPMVPTHAVLDHTADADVGIHLIENASLNYYYCLPNKVFEYLAAGLPILVRDYPELAALVDRYACGWKARSDATSIAQQIDALGPEDLAAVRPGVARAQEELNWQAEETALFAVYAGLRGEGPYA